MEKKKNLEKFQRMAQKWRERMWLCDTMFSLERQRLKVDVTEVSMTRKTIDRENIILVVNPRTSKK
jgi:hypothetical protein